MAVLGHVVEALGDKAMIQHSGGYKPYYSTGSAFQSGYTSCRARPRSVFHNLWAGDPNLREPRLAFRQKVPDQKI